MTKYRAEAKVLGMKVGDEIISYDPEQSVYLTALVERGKLSIVDEEVPDGGAGIEPSGAPAGAGVGDGEGADSSRSGRRQRGPVQL